ncbi:MAG: hypothetical protein HIU57_09205 [Acidobacteria bacterium]|nr:hypothetical protein [Acidobacteriota bacterium]
MARYPHVATRPHAGGELPGPHQHPSDTARLRSVATPRCVSHPLFTCCPTRGVAADFDGVPLGGAGFLTAEGHVSELRDASVTKLRYSGGQRTRWLHDVLDETEPLDAPTLNGVTSGDVG